MGMLSIVFHPDYDTNGTFFVYYLDSVPGVGYRSVVSRFLVSSDPNRADPSSEQIVLTQLQPWNVHKGGLLSFGPDGFLYVPFGDGGLSQSQQDNGQKLDTWLGKILRIDVNSGTPFAVPADNPFVGVAGAMGEIWTMGLRNPWRVTIDQETGNIYLGDVGESRWEEIDVIPAGSTAMNFGWDRMEGNHCLAAEGCEDGAYDAPALEYPHEDGACSVIGGYVYRGCAMPELRGTYFYADYCKAFVRSFVYDAGEITAEHDWTDELQPDGRKLDRITTFGQDARRELYVCDQDGEVFKLVAD
jgi:glucose/arabinose dehydrogenase